MVKDIVEKLANPYDRAARLYPALIMLLPLPVLFVCLYGAKSLLWSSLLSIFSFCGAGYALGRAARDAGKKLEPKLYADWGGAPTTQLLRHSNGRYDSITKGRYHAFLAASIAQTFPSEQAERTDPEKADNVYRASTTWLIGQTRDQKTFDLLFKENVAFGFQRNALGLRPAGIVICFVALLWAALHDHLLTFKAPYFDVSATRAMPEATLVTIAVSVVMLVLWLFVFTTSAVKRVGFAYAERLTESCDKLATKTAPAAPVARKPRTPKPKPDSVSVDVK